MAVFENSRYLHTIQNTRKGWDVPILDVRERFSFNEANYKTYKWKEGDTLDALSVKYWGIAALRWAILDANPQYATEFDIKAGDTINIPAYEEVVSLVNV